MQLHRILLASVLVAYTLVTDARADELPRWEVGLGIVGLSTPDYRGSDQQRGFFLPFPYIQYRGDVLKIDREGAHGDVFTSNYVKLDLSINAAPPVKSGKNGARSGMPDIDPTIEAGPSLQIFFAPNGAHERAWSLRLPLRTVIATDLSHTQRIGWLFAPSLNFDTRGHGGWDFSAAAGPLYATENYHDYYYEVPLAYATVDRPAYNARGGHSGSRLTLTASRRFPTFWVGAFVRYDRLSGAVFVDSPLVRRQESLMVGAGIAYIFSESKKR